MITYLLLLTMLAALALPVSAQEELSLASEAVVLMDADTGQVLYQKNMHQQMYPASITKIMTAMLALQNLSPEAPLTVSQSAVDAVPVTSSHISLKPGEVLTLEQAMYAIGMESANDAANVLAEAVSGSLQNFAELMTDTAQSLGACNTQFRNANGLPDKEHYSTAYDMALITAAALKQPGLTRFFSTVGYLCNATNLSDARAFSNKDRLLEGGQYYYDGVIMAKTGFTNAAQGTFVAVAKRGDTTLIVVALKSPQLEDKYRDTHKLLDYGFNSFTRVTVDAEDAVSRLPLGDFSPAEGQQLHYLIPNSMEASEIAFFLPEDDPVTAAGEELDITLAAAMEGTLLPNSGLHLIRTIHEDEEDAVPVALLESEPTFPLQIPIIAAFSVLLLLLLLRFFRRTLARRHRRRVLKKRIQQMKKRME